MSLQGSYTIHEVVYYLKVDGDKLKTCTVNPKTNAKITKQRVLATEHTKKIECNHKKTQSKRRQKKRKKGTKNRWDK